MRTETNELEVKIRSKWIIVFIFGNRVWVSERIKGCNFVQKGEAGVWGGGGNYRFSHKKSLKYAQSTILEPF